MTELMNGVRTDSCGFRVIVITEPRPVQGEAEAIAGLLDGIAGCRVHLRKPGAEESLMRRLIESLPERLYPQITLQEHLALAPEYGLGGVHPTSRFPDVPAGYKGLVSRSCHSFEEVSECRDADYMFLSPIFDSISKKGYASSFTDAQLRGAAGNVIDRRVIALGGIRPEHFPLLKEYGFGGAAFLGYVWGDCSPAGLKRTIGEIRKYL